MTGRPSPEEFIPKFSRKKLDEPGFLRKLVRVSGRLGTPVVSKLYGFYYVFKSPTTPKRAKIIILGALVYFFSPIDSIPDMLGPLGFSDDIAVITLVYAQMKSYLTDDIKNQAKLAAEKLFK